MIIIEVDYSHVLILYRARILVRIMSSVLIIMEAINHAKSYATCCQKEVIFSVAAMQNIVPA